MAESPAETEIRECIDETARAFRARNIDALMAHYAPDTVAFDLMPLQLESSDAYRKNFKAWFESLQGPIDYEVRDLSITTRDDIAFCHYLGHVKTTAKSGEKRDYWVRVTAGFQNMNGKWMITHEHVSVPFTTMETMLAALASAGRSVPA